jgi:D-sedoheptulose 7-phosphate isomerase
MHDCLAEHIAAVQQMSNILPVVEKAASAICTALAAGGRVFTFGNGGSAADAQHFAAELVGRYRIERQPLPAIALTTDPSVLTCIGNDYNFTEIFARQVQGLARAGDMVIGFSTSGNSVNVCRGLSAAQAVGARTIAFTGISGGRAAEIADFTLMAPSANTARIQELHVLMIHMICDQIDVWAAAQDH